MWFVILLTLCSAALPQGDFINTYRISIGWAQLGVFEFGLAIGLVVALIKGGDYAARFPILRTHPVMTWLMVFFTIGSLAGLIGSLNSMMPMKYKVSGAREFIAMPICIIMGYRMLATPKQMTIYSYVTILAGVLTAIGVMFYFNEQAEKVEVTGNISYLRGNIKQFSPEFGSCAGLLLLWSLASGRRMFANWLALLTMLFCFVGYLALVSRTNVVIMLGGAFALLWIIPAGRRVASVIRLIVLGPIIVGVLYLSLIAGGAIVGRYNFVEKITDHFATLLPSERKVGEAKAWDSRLGSIIQEFQLWLDNPLFGQGFAAQEGKAFSGEIANTAAYNHNGWTSTLAKTGIFGFAGVVLMLGSMIVLGYKMVRDQTDRAFVLFGAVIFITGVVFLLRATCTMAFISRSAIHYAVVCGMALRAREMELTTRAMQAAGAYEPYVDPGSGLIVPDYQASGFSGLGSVN